jgi:hypothetical protein
MPQLARGARQALDYLYADLDDILEYVADNPDAVRILVHKCKRRLTEDIEPRLQRAAPSLEKKVADLEERLDRLEQQRFAVESKRHTG